MPILQNILLGVLIGFFVSQARIDSVWWSHIGTPLDALKSKVPLTSRGNAANFYRAVSDSPYNFDYFLLTSVALLLFSFVGGIVQHPNKRVLNVISFVLVFAATIVELGFAQPLIRLVIAKKTSGKLIEHLYMIGIYHAVVLACLVFTMLVQVSSDAEQAEEEEEDVVPKVKKSKKQE